MSRDPLLESSEPLLDPSQPLRLRVSSDDGVHSLRAELGRYDAAGGRVFVSWPTEHLRLYPFRPGQNVVVEVPRPGDAMYELETLVEFASREEPPRLVLRIVGDWQRVQRRQAIRHAVDMRPTQVRHLHPGRGPVAMAVAMRDLSAGGMRLVTDSELTSGDDVELVFGTPSGGAELRLRVRVVRAVPSGSNWEIGCQFVEPSAAERERIVQFILAQQDAIARS